MAELCAILWDLDGTLIDSDPWWAAAEQAYAARYGGTWSAADAAACVGRPLEVTAQRLQTSCGIDRPVSEICGELITMMAATARAQPPRFQPGARELVEEAHRAGVRQAVVTLSQGEYVQAVASHLPWFEQIITGDCVDAPKPDPDAYLLAMERLGVDPSECVVVEDSATGIAAGYASGALTVGLETTGTNLAELNLPGAGPNRAARRSCGMRREPIALANLAGVTLPNLRTWHAGRQ